MPMHIQSTLNFYSTFSAYQKVLTDWGWRSILILQGETNWRSQIANNLIKKQSWSKGLSFSSIQKPPHFQQYLGQEFDYIYIDSDFGLHPDLICALAGTIKVGGLFILTLADDCYSNDNIMQQALPWSTNTTATHSHFNQRLVKLTEQSEQTLYFRQQGNKVSGQWPVLNQIAATHWQKPNGLTLEQQSILNQLKQVASGHFTLSADRGRGKSALLGSVAAYYLQQGKSIIVTAPAKRCLQIFYQWAGSSVNSENLRFQPPDQLQNAELACDLLIVDEAAALPSQLLHNISLACEFVIYATTIHGYEGSGKGFKQHFIKTLNQRTATHNHFQLQRPIRWAPSDHLEQWLNTVFLLDLDCPQPKLKQSKQLAEVAPIPFSIKWLEPADLTNNEQQLKSCFALLMQAHYKTTPNDLKYMLDSPFLKLAAIISASSNILAIVLLSQEGQLPEQLALDCMDGTRRPNGHLTSQIIAAQLGTPEFCKLLGWRIVRIAVQPDMQHSGVGSRLLNWLQEQAIAEKIDFLSASFAASPHVLKFWHKNDYHLVRISTTAEHHSGLHSVLYINAISSSCDNLLDQIKPLALQNYLINLTTRYIHVPSESLWLWAAHLPFSLPPVQKSFVKSFAYANTNFFAAHSALLYYCLQQANDVLTLDTKDMDILASTILRQTPITTVCDQFAFTGQKAMIKYLRQLIDQLILKESS
ncbi:GNAT family N-acetyltransferase [Catenovulum sediminis]|uniref:GNAT family N-acetyltransferase n=1 Tax=Catenovulum sediminis TaxID=1740262 RepID=A0ABV1RHK4_9ALTE|nr:GNAT family N-acetyltransferase [Catenovulum sediminis]